MSDEVAAAVRCRRSQCNNYDTDPPKFQKCGRCRLARYCSRECQLQDWPLHKLMCSADRVLLNEDGTTTPIGAAALAAAGSPVPAPAAAAAAAPAASTVGADGRDKSVGELLAAAQAKVRDNPYIPHSEMDNKELVSLVVDRLQMQTSPFVVMQLTSGAPPGFLFVQTESPLEDFRWSTGKRADGTKLDRTLNVIYSNLQEFTEEISVGHPNPMLRANKLISTLRSEVNKHSPQEDLVSVAVFGCGFVSCQTSPLAPYKTVLQLVEQDPDMFQGQDAIEICLDRDDA